MPRKPKPMAYVYDSMREIRIIYSMSPVTKWNRLVKAIKKEIVKEAKKRR